MAPQGLDPRQPAHRLPAALCACCACAADLALHQPSPAPLPYTRSVPLAALQLTAIMEPPSQTEEQLKALIEEARQLAVSPVRAAAA